MGDQVQGVPRNQRTRASLIREEVGLAHLGVMALSTRGSTVISTISLGATYLGGRRCHFRVWAPGVQHLEVRVLSPEDRVVPLHKGHRGYHQALVEKMEPGSLYLYRLDGQKERPDPASRFQPQEVHGPSQIMDPSFDWNDAFWSGLPLRDYLIYEVHTGTFTAEGTFEAMIRHLEELNALGITALELMPVAQFPGTRNWGYDGVYPFAVQNSYGGPAGLKRLVDACHLRGLAVVLDVVYNHLGPEGNYFGDFGPYFTDRYRSPWGQAINFDGAHSDEVRRFFIENALYWVTEFHVDALRIDAVHAILDFSARPFLEELARAVHVQAELLNRRVYLISESNLNDTRLVRAPELCGFGLDAQWNDDFHHSLHALLTGERVGYYEDFGEIRHLAKALGEGFVYSGEYSSYRRRHHGHSSVSVPGHRFVVFAQNHDQVGNRPGGERLSRLISFEAAKLAAGVVLLSPYVPLLFMGEEYGEPAPFEYFVSHSDQSLVDEVRRGRREEFDASRWLAKPADPQDESTYLRAKLNHDLRSRGSHEVLLEFYRELIRLRRQIPALRMQLKENLEVQSFDAQRILTIRRWSETEEVAAVFHFGEERETLSIPLPKGRWDMILDSAAERWHGPGEGGAVRLTSGGDVTLSLAPWSFFLYLARREQVN
jgi:maltooligosyltrehalose trehalohydrolase